MRSVLIVISGCLLGIIIGILLIYFTPFFSPEDKSALPLQNILQKRQVIGFLPYWLLSSAKTDYSNYITTLTYFGLNIDNDGTILKLSDPQEEEPGWNALSSGIVDPFLKSAKEKGVGLSLLLFDGDNDAIDRLMDDPVSHADNLVSDVVPLMRKYNFTDVNLDIEYTTVASSDSQMRFTKFVKEVKKELDKQNTGTLTIEISPTDLIREDLINLKSIAPFADNVVIMAYDFHYTGSYVTGPVAPLGGAGTIAEYDTKTAVNKALEVAPAQKIILGVPLYGYEWETIDNVPRSGIVPGSGLSISSRKVASFEQSCASCSARLDSDAQESYLIYKDDDSGTYHQIFYPDENSVFAKTEYADTLGLGGMALWALGYEDGTIMNPLKSYK